MTELDSGQADSPSGPEGDHWDPDRPRVPDPLLKHHHTPSRLARSLHTNATSLYRVTRCTADKPWHGYYGDVPPLPLLSSASFHAQTGRWGEEEEEGQIHPFTHSHRQAWHGNLLWCWCKETGTLKSSHPPPPPHEMALWSWSVMRGEARRTPCHSVTWCHQPWPQPGPQPSTARPCVWFIHNKASIIQAHDQVVLWNYPKSVYMKTSSIISADHRTWC